MKDSKTDEQIKKLEALKAKVSDEKAKKAFDEKIKGLKSPFNK